MWYDDTQNTTGEKEVFWGQHPWRKPSKGKIPVQSFLACFPSTTPTFDLKRQDLVCVIVYLKGLQDTQSSVFLPHDSSMAHLHLQTIKQCKNRWHSAPMHGPTGMQTPSPTRFIYMKNNQNSRYCMESCLPSVHCQLLGGAEIALIALSSPSWRQRRDREQALRYWWTSWVFSW